MSFFSGSRCCISPALAEKQRCYVFFHRSINDHHPVFFSWNAALVLVYSLSCDMNFRGSGILTNTLEWWIKRSRMAAVSALSWWYPPQKITSSDIIITTKWHRNYQRLTERYHTLTPSLPCKDDLIIKSDTSLPLECPIIPSCRWTKPHIWGRRTFVKNTYSHCTNSDKNVLAGDSRFQH